MADIEYGDSVGEVYSSDGHALVSIMNWLGALISMALIAGLGWWGYQLMVRDVSGVPVVRALEGPMRVAPDDPGGKSADHQGLAVNNIAAVGTAQDPADRLELAPKPTALQDEDETSEELDLVVQADEVSPLDDTNRLAVLTEEDPAPLAVETAGAAEANEPTVADTASLIDAALQEAVQSEPPRTVEPVRQSAAALTPEDLVPASVGGVARSLVPQVRPSEMEATAPVATEEATPATVKTVDPAAIPAGTRLAQLGAFESEEIAKQEWLTLSEKFGDYMADKSQVVQRAQSGGKVFYRLRAYGFDDLSDARRFCSALLAGQANCIPVVTR